MFELIKDRPYDLLVTARGLTGEGQPARRIEIFHAEEGAVFDQVYDATEKRFLGQPELLLSEALDCLLSHARSRLLAHQPFAVWFYTIDEKDYVLQAAVRLHGGRRTYVRVLEQVVKRARIASEAPPD